MITDPAWFYSSLAQASAAIVGLMGGILTARVSDHLALKRRERGELMTEIKNAQRHLIGRQTHLASFREFIRGELALDRAALEAQHATRPATAVEIGWGFSRGAIMDPIAVAEDEAQREAELRLVDRVLPFYEVLSGRITTETVSTEARRLKNAGGELVSDDVGPLEQVARKLQPFSDSVLPRSFPVVVGLLAWLALVGVIWPLSVLPGIPASSWMMGKPPMLTAFTAGIVGLLVYLTVELVDIWRLGVIEAPTREELGL